MHESPSADSWGETWAIWKSNWASLGAEPRRYTNHILLAGGVGTPTGSARRLPARLARGRLISKTLASTFHA
jgi:hypothetical protein